MESTDLTAPAKGSSLRKPETQLWPCAVSTAIPTSAIPRWDDCATCMSPRSGGASALGGNWWRRVWI